MLAAFVALAALPACGARTALRVGVDVPSVDVPSVDVPSVDVPSVDVFDPGCLADPARCDDRDLCTADTCLPNGRCAHEAIRCDDGDACTDDRCAPDRGCFVSVTDCDDRNLCTVDRCDRALGCLRAPVACDDRDPCTANRCEPIRGCVFPATDCGGCADGQRDAFRDVASHPAIAACAGGFTNAGLSRDSSPTCERGAGDDGPNPIGRGCSASDLCAPGWHVCRSVEDVATHSPDGCRGADDADASAFFATRQTGPGCGHCATGSDLTCGSTSCRTGCAQTDQTTNDIFGCGTLGQAAQASSLSLIHISEPTRPY